MVIFKNQRTKIACAILGLICAIIAIYLQMTKPIIKVNELAKDEKANSKVQIKSSLSSDYDVKLYQKTEEEQEFTEVKNKEERSIFNKASTFEIDTKDTAKPNNVTNLNTLVVDDYVIISFEKAKDNGTEYEYYIQGSKENDNIKTETSKIYKESGIKGYNYIIDNDENSVAGFEVNKYDSEPILYTKLQWDKNYYIHIRAIDNNNNYSENLTYKIALPSRGLRMQYVDINNHSEISPQETIIGNANDEYNIKEYNKNLEGYKLIEVDGDETGTLKKERTNVKYMYAKNAVVIVKHLDKKTGKEISSKEKIEGYEGKKFNVKNRNLEKYLYNNGEIDGKMKAGMQEINLYYDEIGKVNISYKNYLTKENIIPPETIKGAVDTEYNTKAKEIKGYELLKVEGNSNGSIKSKDTFITYYYKKKTQITIKHVDIDTKKVLDSETIKGYEGDKIETKSKEFEGYILKDNYSEYENELKKQKEKKDKEKNISKTSTIEASDKPEKEENSIIDEILEEENLENTEAEEIKIENTIRQYDIIMDCGKTEYIIYYKKI